MMHKCAHNKFGTVLYRKGGDVLVVLSWVLSASHPFNDYLYEPEHFRKNPDVDTTLKEASIIINDFIHDESKTHLT